MSLTMGNTIAPRINMPEGAANLPPAARQRLRLLLDARDAAWDQRNGASRRMEVARVAVERLEEALADQRENDRPRVLGGQAGALPPRKSPTDRADPLPPRQTLTEELAAARVEFDRRRAISEASDEASQPLSALATRITDYLQNNLGSTYGDAPPPVVKVVSTKFAAQIEQARRAVSELVAERDATRTAPAADGELRRGIEAAVADMATRGRPLLARGADGIINWPTHRAEVFTMGGGVGGTTVPDAIAALAWFSPDTMTEKLYAEAVEQRRATGQPPGLPRAARTEALIRLEAQILAAERMEEATIVALEASGFPVVRRPEADVRAVLGFDGPAPASST